ncbi:hypothetical protein [Streptomyces sp. Je 1-332]|uniref:hypothetical protein n=1 Tax=Streptomyces sp. Je 1-332 TaxID=3231270 RepID=UPI00345833B0
MLTNRTLEVEAEAPHSRVGTVVVDTVGDPVAECRGATGGLWALRPLGGGREWDVAPDKVRPATDGEILGERLAVENRRAAWGREVGAS